MIMLSELLILEGSSEIVACCESTAISLLPARLRCSLRDLVVKHLRKKLHESP